MSLYVFPQALKMPSKEKSGSSESKTFMIVSYIYSSWLCNKLSNIGIKPKSPSNQPVEAVRRIAHMALITFCGVCVRIYFSPLPVLTSVRYLRAFRGPTFIRSTQSILVQGPTHDLVVYRTLLFSIFR